MERYSEIVTTNLFKVKNIEAFADWASDLGLEVDEVDGKVSTSADSYHYLEWPLKRFDDDTGEPTIALDFVKELSTHLKEDSVAVFIHVGHAYSTPIGEAIAINSKGESKRIRLLDIYTVAQTLGGEVEIPELHLYEIEAAEQ